MNRLWSALLLAGLVALSATPASALASPAAHAADRDCGHFPNQAAAQAHYVSLGGPAVDPDRLDADDNGRACDSLPCPCSGGGGTVPRDPVPVAKSHRARLVKVIDGDTVKVRLTPSKKRRTVRIIGIDTPETKRPGVKVECGGRAASRNMKRLAPVGAVVTLRTDPTQATYDRYGRLLAYVSRRGKDTGRAQIRAGLATTYIFNAKPFQRATAYQASEAAAKAAKRGVYGACAGDFHSGQS